MSILFREFYSSFYEDEDKMSLKSKEEIIMKFVKVDKLPKTNRSNHTLQCRIEEFMRMNVPVVLIELAPGEYSSVNTARSSWVGACVRSGYPVVCRQRSNKIYLVRKDMQNNL